MVDLSYEIAVSGEEKLIPLAAGITAVTNALDKGKGNAAALAAFKASFNDLGGSLGGLKSLEKTLKDSIGGLGKALKSQMDQLSGVLSTAAADFKSSGQKAGKALSDGLVDGVEDAGRALKLAADRNLKLNAKYATDIETAVRQIQEKGTSSMLQSLQTRASFAQRILQSEAKDAVAIAQKAYGSDFVAAMQTGLQGKLSVLTNSHQATIRLLRTQQEQTIKEGREAAAKLAEATAKARANSATKLTTEDDTRRMLGLATRSEMNTHSASIRAQMQAEVDKLAVRGKAATKLTTEDDTRRMLGLATRSEMTRHLASIRAQMEQGARDAQGRDIMQVRAATNNPVGAYQSYNSKTQTPGKVMGIPTDQDVGKVKELSGAFKQLNIDGNDVHSAMRGLASGFNLLWLTWGKLVPLFAGASISFGLKKTFDIGSEVEYQIKFMETLGQTTKEQGKIIRQALRDIDQTTQFSLVELSQAMVRLGQAGQTPAEALATLKPAADLASVGMTDLKVATDLLIQTQALFGKSAADSGKIAAQIFVATKSGVLNVEDIAGSMKYASEANTRFGKSLEETLAILGALAQAGLKGSSGGTAYINFLRDINGRSGPAVKALADLGKATGKTIEVFDSLGKQRSAVDIFNDISNAADKLSAKDADKILARIFSDRGGRTFFAMVREGTIDLAKMVDVLKEVKPEELLKGAQGLMDTTKGALNILQGAMVGALDKVFEANSDKFKAFIVDITKAVDSKEFLLSVQAVVAGALSLYETIKSLLPVIEALGTAWLVFKAGSFGVAVFQGLAQALGGMVPMLATTNAQLLNNTKALFTNTGAWQANGIAVVENAAVQRAAAASQAVGAGALSATAVAAAKAGAAATVATVGMRALTGVIGFMANPIVGVITTLGLLGYAFWSAKKDATASIADTTESVLENGKINIAQWDKEIIRLRERNNLMGQADGYSGAEAQARVAQQALALEVKEYERLAKAKDFADRRGSGFSVGDKKRMDESLERIKKGERDINKVYSDIEAARLKDMSDRQEKERQAEARRNANKPQGSTPLPPAGKPFGGSQKEFDRYADDKSLKAIENQTNSELAALKAGYDAKKVIQDNAYKNMLVSQGQYQADALFSTAQYEEESIQAITQGQEKYFDEFVIKYDELRRLRDGEKVDSTFWKQYNAEMDKAINEEVSYHDAGQAKIVAIREEAAKRIKLSMQDIQGETEKLIKADKDYWVKTKGETAKIAALQKVEEQYHNINQSVFSTATAEKAAALAKSESLENSRQQIEMMKRELAIRKETVDFLEAEIALRSNLALNKGETWAGLSEAKNTVAALRGSISKLEDQIADGTANAITDGARRGALAYDKEMKAKAAALTDVLADSIETALTEGGAAGAKKLKAYLLKTLVSEPIMLQIKMALQPMVGGIVGAGASGAGAGAGGGAGGMGNFGGLSNAYGAFAKSGVGQSLGLSTGAVTGNNPSAYVAPQLTSAGQMGAKAMGMVGDTLAGYAMGSMFNSLISGGYSMGKGMDTFQKVGTAVGSAIGGPIVGAVIGAAAGALNRIFGRKLKDSGIQGEFGGTRGFEGESYEYYKGGLLRSDKTKTNPLAEDARKVLGDAFSAMRIEVGTFATALGLSAAKIENFSTKFKVSTKGLSDADAEKVIQEALATANNELAMQVLGSYEKTIEQVVSQLQYRTGGAEGGDISYETVNSTIETISYTASTFSRDGEKAIDTLNRLATSLTTVNGSMELLGFKLMDVSLAGADAASSLVDAFGGLEAFSKAVNSYYDNFYSEEEKLANITQSVTQALAAVNLEMPTTREGFRTLVEEQMALGDSGTGAVAALLGVSGAFASVVPAANVLSETMRRLQSDSSSLQIELLQAQGRESEALALRREIETQGFNAAEVAAYDYNQSLRASITATNAASAALKAYKTAASSISTSKDTLAGIVRSPVEIAQNALNQTLLRLNETLKPANVVKDDYTYFTLYQDVLDFWKSESGKGGALAGVSAEEYAQIHYESSGKSEGRMSPQEALDLITTLVPNFNPLTLDDVLKLDTSNQGSYSAEQWEVIADVFEKAANVKLAAETPVTPATSVADPSNTALSDILQERMTLQEQYDKLTMTSTQLLEKERNALHESNRALFDSIQMETEKAKQANIRTGLERQLMDLTNDTVAVRKLEIEGMDTANVALYDRVALLKKEAAATQERNGLMTSLLQSLGNTAALRAQTLASLDPSNRALQQQVWQIEDAKAALTKALAAEAESAQAAQQAASERVSTLKSIFDTLKSNVQSLYETVEATKMQSAQQANAFIDNALANARATGYLPEGDALTEAISGARGGLDKQYASDFERKRDTLVLAGKLAELQDISGGQLTIAERQLRAAEDQLDVLGMMRKQGQDLLDSLSGNTTATLSIVDAIAGLSAAVLAAAAAAANKGPAFAPYSLDDTPALRDVKVAAQNGLDYSKATTPEVKAAMALYASINGGANTAFFNSALEGIGGNFSAIGWDGSREGAEALRDKYSFAVGINRVPHDMTARIHKDEAVVPAALNPYNPNASQNGLGGGNTQRLEALIEGLTNRVASLQTELVAIKTNTGQMAEQFDEVTEGGNAMRSRAVGVAA